MSRGAATSLVKEITGVAKSFQSMADLKDVVNRVKQARVVMMGEASHGTHEFYEWRRLISQELMEKHGFNFISVEGDWPPSQQVNRFINQELDNKEQQDELKSATALRRRVRDVLRHFRRWPTWMWANVEVEELVAWMHTHNREVAKPEDRVGFYGLDVYSLFESIEEALKELEEVDPAMARKARLRYQCFDPYIPDEQEYVRSLLYYPAGCKDAVVRTLQELVGKRMEEMEQGKRGLLFDAVQNARIVKNAEAYYRAMIEADDKSWNIRDQHMMETLEQLLEHYGPGSKGIVWAHNTHIGDYRATNMQAQGEINIGGLAREKYGEDRVALLGFSTFEGTVVASHAWGAPAQVLCVPPGRPGSWDLEMHRAAESMRADKLALVFEKRHRQKGSALVETRGQRAIGVVYNPAHERWGNYVPTALAKRYDVMIFLNDTKALTPLGLEADEKEVPLTYPYAV